MESMFLKSFTGILDYCYKDAQTVYLLKKGTSSDSGSSNLVEIMELDLLH